MIKIIRLLFLKSTIIEVVFRCIYWKLKIFKYINVKEFNHINELNNFDKILEKLKSIGVKNGSILIIHSSYDSLKNCSINPKEIINSLIDLIGEDGTLVMNSARVLKKDKSRNDILKYDVKKSRVWTGVLPHVMVNDKRSEVSEFPFNPIVAIGKHAKKITTHNFNNNVMESSCGPNSGWKFCSDNNAIVVGLGVNLTHSLTIMHVAEENHKNWPIDDWYDIIKVEIINNNTKNNVVIKNRKEKWGKLYFLEKNLEKDLKVNKILNEENIDGLNFSNLNSKELINFLNKKNHDSTYPYLIPFFVK